MGLGSQTQRLPNTSSAKSSSSACAQLPRTQQTSRTPQRLHWAQTDTTTPEFLRGRRAEKGGGFSAVRLSLEHHLEWGGRSHTRCVPCAFGTVADSFHRQQDTNFLTGAAISFPVVHISDASLCSLPYSSPQRLRSVMYLHSAFMHFVPLHHLRLPRPLRFASILFVGALFPHLSSLISLLLPLAARSAAPCPMYPQTASGPLCSHRASVRGRSLCRLVPQFADRDLRADSAGGRCVYRRPQCARRVPAVEPPVDNSRPCMALRGGQGNRHLGFCSFEVEWWIEGVLWAQRRCRCLCSFSPWAAQKSKFSKLIFFDTVIT